MPPTPSSGRDSRGAIRHAGLIAGVGLLLMAALSGFGYFVAVKGLVTPGDAARTAAAIKGSETLFRFGIVALFVVAVLDVVVAWALYHVFRPVSDNLSMLAAWLRVAYAAVFLIAIVQLLEVPQLLENDRPLAVFKPALVLARIDAFNDIWHAGLVLFGVHLLVIAYRSRTVPKLVAVLLAVAGLGYLFDSFAAALTGSSPEVSSYTFFGEFLLAVWLTTRGSRGCRRRTVTTTERGNVDLTEA
ncbi:MAG: DUF4386 domain-containing protein [Ilumatobacteraceae bacterium]|nr:DUF4386 domain-containing protein [Ilumatobacteraceae bacterium]